ncbi:hypothetical protein BD779DRAFT_1507283 [Infundibulicybe gibba]|nr:hypothetical protein BD779DRAFT_1507283 [Infundibulicybe gibba]
MSNGHYSVEQAHHDEINLKRLVKRLEQVTSEDGWEGPPSRPIWIKALGTLQKVKFARKLLNNVESCLDDSNPQSLHKFREIRETIDQVEEFMQAAEKRAAPPIKRPAAVLPSVPIPVAQVEVEEISPEPIPQDPISTSNGVTDNLLLSPSDSREPQSISPMPTLITPSTISRPSQTNAVTTGAAPRFLNNSTALQQELQDQLAQMATQLKRNALHFSDSLSKDQAVVEDAQQKLELNSDIMTKERIRLRDHRGKAGSTSCLIFLILAVAVMLFVAMVALIRLT